MAKLKEGDKVICVDDYFEDCRTNPFKMSEINLPEEDKRYTIREVIKNSSGTGVRLEEIINKKYYFQDIHREEEPTFGVNRFQLLKNS
jgi:hypothetical protein